MTTTVVHANRRGVFYTYVQDDGPNFGYSARVAYAMGLDRPRHPLPATMDNAILALFNQKEVGQWAVPYFKPRFDAALRKGERNG